MSLSVQDALTQLDSLTAAVIAATEAEMCTAAYVLARATRDAHPAAATVLMDESDQGDWLSVQGWQDSAGTDHDLLLTEDASDDAARHLCTAHISADDQVGVVRGLCCTDRRRGFYRLAVDQVLSSPTIRTAMPIGLGLAEPDRRFRERDCDLLAVAIHDLTGWPLVVVADYAENDLTRFGWVHALVTTPHGTYLDVDGEHDGEA